MYVMKFEGIAIDNPEALWAVKKSVENCKEACVVIISASSGLSARLGDMFEVAMSKGEGFLRDFSLLKDEFEEKVYDYVPQERQQACLEQLRKYAGQLLLTLSCNAMLKEYREMARDFVVALGEKMLAALMGSMLGVKSADVAGHWVISDENWGSASLQWDECRQVVAVGQDMPDIVLLSGKCGRSKQGHATVLSEEEAAKIGKVWA